MWPTGDWIPDSCADTVSCSDFLCTDSAVTQVAIDFQRKRLQSTIAAPYNRKVSTYDGILWQHSFVTKLWSVGSDARIFWCQV